MPVYRPLRQYRGSLLRRCSEMHYGNVRLQTNATTWFSGPVASHNELTMFQFCNLFTHSWNYFMGCYILLWTPDASRPNCIMWLWCSWNQIPCLGKGFVCISTFPECIAVGHVLAIDEVVYAARSMWSAACGAWWAIMPWLQEPTRRVKMKGWIEIEKRYPNITGSMMQKCIAVIFFKHLITRNFLEKNLPSGAK